MTTWKTWVLLLLAFAAGSVASVGVKELFFVERDVVVDESQGVGARSRIIAANGVVRAGTELNAQNVKLVLLPEIDVPKGALDSFFKASGQIVARDFKDGEIITDYDLAESFNPNVDSEAAFIPPGYLVVPIEIRAVSKENGSRNYLKTAKLDKIIKPGDVVDISVVKEDSRKSAASRLVTETIAANVEVFATSDETRFGSDGLTRVSTLSALLSTEQTARVRKAYDEGKLKILFRNGSSDERMDLTPASASADLTSNFVLPSANESFVIATPEDATVEDEESSLAVAPNPSSVTSVAADKRNEETTASPADVNSSFVIAVDESENEQDEQDGQNDEFDSFLSETARENDAPATDSSREVDESSITNNQSKVDAPRWNRVDFSERGTGLVEQNVRKSFETPLGERSWTGGDTFRSRAYDAQVGRYSLAPSADPIADDSASERNVVVPSAEGGALNDADGASKKFQKVSPFVTVSSKKKR